MKPSPKIVSEVCSLCGLDWKLHGKNPTADKCVSLLLAEVQSLNAQLAVRPVSYPVPYPVYPQPWPRPWRPYVPYWSNGTSWGYNATLRTTDQTISLHTPASSGAHPMALTVRAGD